MNIIRKKIYLEIKLTKKHTLLFNCYEATLAEFIEMSELMESQPGFNVIDWLDIFFREKAVIEKGHYSKKLFEQIRKSHIEKIFNMVFDAMFSGFVGDRKKTDKNKNSDTINLKGKPLSASLCLIMKETGETFDSLLNKTSGQLDFLSEGVAWNLNAQTKKGQKINERNYRQKVLQDVMTDEEALAIINKSDNKK